MLICDVYMNKSHLLNNIYLISITFFRMKWRKYDEVNTFTTFKCWRIKSFIFIIHAYLSKPSSLPLLICNWIMCNCWHHTIIDHYEFISSKYFVVYKGRAHMNMCFSLNDVTSGKVTPSKDNRLNQCYKHARIRRRRHCIELYGSLWAILRWHKHRSINPLLSLGCVCIVPMSLSFHTWNTSLF